MVRPSSSSSSSSSALQEIVLVEEEQEEEEQDEEDHFLQAAPTPLESLTTKSSASSSSFSSSSASSSSSSTSSSSFSSSSSLSKLSRSHSHSCSHLHSSSSTCSFSELQLHLHAPPLHHSSSSSSSAQIPGTRRTPTALVELNSRGQVTFQGRRSSHNIPDLETVTPENAQELFASLQHNFASASHAQLAFLRRIAEQEDPYAKLCSSSSSASNLMSQLQFLSQELQSLGYNEAEEEEEEAKSASSLDHNRNLPCTNKEIAAITDSEAEEEESSDLQTSDPLDSSLSSNTSMSLPNDSSMAPSLSSYASDASSSSSCSFSLLLSSSAAESMEEKMQHVSTEIQHQVAQVPTSADGDDLNQLQETLDLEVHLNRTRACYLLSAYQQQVQREEQSLQRDAFKISRFELKANDQHANRIIEFFALTDEEHQLMQEYLSYQEKQGIPELCRAQEEEVEENCGRKGPFASSDSSTARTIVMSAFDAQAHSNSFSSASLLVEKEEVACSVCASPDVEAEDDILYCDRCNVALHQSCYGLEEIPQGEFYCDPCRVIATRLKRQVEEANLSISPILQQIQPRCIICYQRGGGAMRACRVNSHEGRAKKYLAAFLAYSASTSSPPSSIDLSFYDQGVTSDLYWAHLVCCHSIPELRYDEEKGEILGYGLIDRERFKMRCSLCKVSARGACAQCISPKCVTAFHPHCALMFGMELKKMASFVGEEEDQHVIFCSRHRTSLPLKLTFSYQNDETNDVSEVNPSSLSSSSSFSASRHRGHDHDADDEEAEDEEGAQLDANVIFRRCFTGVSASFQLNANDTSLEDEVLTRWLQQHFTQRRANANFSSSALGAHRHSSSSSPSFSIMSVSKSAIRRLTTPLSAGSAYTTSSSACCVCRVLNQAVEVQQPLLTCNICALQIHAECYGVEAMDLVDAADFTCLTCKAKSQLLATLNQNVSFSSSSASRALATLPPFLARNFACSICLSSSPGLKSTDDRGWCHISCVSLIHELFFDRQDNGEVIKGCQAAFVNRAALTCIVCHKKGGACAKCSVIGCQRSFHVACGLNSGFEIRELKEEERGPNFSARDSTFITLCDLHSASATLMQEEEDEEEGHTLGLHDESDDESDSSEEEESCSASSSHHHRHRHHHHDHHHSHSRRSNVASSSKFKQSLAKLPDSSSFNSDRSSSSALQALTCSICEYGFHLDASFLRASLLLTCSSCGVKVHALCYGVTQPNQTEEEEWQCRVCETLNANNGTNSSSEANPSSSDSFSSSSSSSYSTSSLFDIAQPQCVICLKPGGSLIRVASTNKSRLSYSASSSISPSQEFAQSRWCHIPCAFWMPELFFKENLVDGVDKALVSRRQLNCVFCHQTGGAALQCHHPACFKSFHLTCAKEAGCQLQELSQVKGNASAFVVFCLAHSKKSYTNSSSASSSTFSTSSSDVKREAKLCEICSYGMLKNAEATAENLTFFTCSSCGLTVHQICYNASMRAEEADENWLCQLCALKKQAAEEQQSLQRNKLIEDASSLSLSSSASSASSADAKSPARISCVICLRAGGAMKPTICGRFCHVTCAFFVPQLFFVDAVKSEPIGGIHEALEASSASSATRKCHLCSRAGGATVRCSSATCKHWTHVTCAHEARNKGYELREETMGKKQVFLIFCSRHSKFNQKSKSSSFSSSCSSFSLSASSSAVSSISSSNTATGKELIAAADDDDEGQKEKMLQKKESVIEAKSSPIEEKEEILDEEVHEQDSDDAFTSPSPSTGLKPRTSNQSASLALRSRLVSSFSSFVTSPVATDLAVTSTCSSPSSFSSSSSSPCSIASSCKPLSTEAHPKAVARISNTSLDSSLEEDEENIVLHQPMKNVPIFVAHSRGQTSMLNWLKKGSDAKKSQSNVGFSSASISAASTASNKPDSFKNSSSSSQQTPSTSSTKKRARSQLSASCIEVRNSTSRSKQRRSRKREEEEEEEEERDAEPEEDEKVEEADAQDAAIVLFEDDNHVTNQELFCVCQQPYCEGQEMMVACDNEECTNGCWFHLSCVGLGHEPQDKHWFCPACAANQRVTRSKRARVSL